MSTLACLFIAYTILWTLVLLFTFCFARRQGELEGEIEALREESPPG